MSSDPSKPDPIHNRTEIDAGSPSDQSKAGRRRPRYRGTHPRRFAEKYKELRPDVFPEAQDHVRAQGRTPAGSHVPIMVGEIMAALAPSPGHVVVDCTLGYGGHAEAILKKIQPDGTLLGLDVDARQLEAAGGRLRALGLSARILLHRGNFAGIEKALGTHGLVGCDLVLADLGVSSMQVDDPARGFSYKEDGPLDMRMDDRRTRSAADLLAVISEEALAIALHECADDPDAAAVARAIVEARRRAPFTRTLQLSHLVMRAKGWTPKSWREHKRERPRELHPAARTFQTLRILVNDELQTLEQLLRILPWVVRPGGRMALISFHSGEHRRIQDAIAEGLRLGHFSDASGEPLHPTAEEIRSNPRSSAARLHWIRRSNAPS